jgi:hypothetical protein
MPRLKFRARGGASQASSKLLPYSPPIVSSPEHRYLTPSETAINLNTDGVLDYVIHFPSEPMTGGFVRLNGRDVARNIIAIGGDIQPPPLYDPVTLRLLSNSNTSYITSSHGFMNANGGQFRVRGGSNAALNASTALLDWDISDAELLAEINLALGAGACFEVRNQTAPDHPGGPWWFVPGQNNLMGYATVVNVSLTAPVGQTVLLDSNHPTVAPPNAVPFTQFLARSNGYQALQWTGHCHIEGAKVYSPDMNDAWNTATKHADAILTLQNCYFRSGGRIWHNDWIHPDGAQHFQGPPKLFADHCTFISIGAACINQPRNQPGTQTGPNSWSGLPENLYDWKYSNCDFQSYMVSPLTNDPSLAYSVHESWNQFPSTTYNWTNAGQNDAGWVHHHENTWVEIFNVDTGLPDHSGADNKYYSHLRTGTAGNFNDIPDGVTIKAVPTIADGASVNGHFCDPDANPAAAGLEYVSPGYQYPDGTGLPEVIQRLDGETGLTPLG